MIEKIIEAIGRFLSSIFRKSNDLISDAKVEMNMMAEQTKMVKVNTQSTLTISISGESHVNYFRNRVVGEFLRVMASLVPYRYEESSALYVAYFVRHKRRGFVEYIKFTKRMQEDEEAYISYTYLNKIISSTGVTTNIGNTANKVLMVDDNISNCIYDSISGKKAPLYLVHVLDNKIGVGNPTFVYDCWILTTKVIARKVDRYILNEDNKDGPLIETLINQAGIHMYMSYFRSLSNPFYRTYYTKREINSIVDAVKDYNSRHFNTNKILNFSFDPSNKVKGVVEVNKEKNYSTLTVYGVTIKFSGIISEVGDNAVKRFNYKLVETLIKAEDAILTKNFLFYIFSTGGLDDQEIVQLKEEGEVENAKSSDPRITEFNNRVEPVVNEVMKQSNFTVDDDGDLASADFEQFIKSEVSSKSATANIFHPSVDEPMIVSDDIETIPQEPRIGGAIEALRRDSESSDNITSAVETSVEDKSKDTDIVRRLQEEATGEQTISRPVSEVTEMESAAVDTSKSTVELLSTPLTQWTTEDCLKVLATEGDLASNITRQDILDRMMFLASRDKG